MEIAVRTSGERPWAKPGSVRVSPAFPAGWGMFSPSSKDPVRRLAECWDTEPASSLFPLEVFSSVGGAKLKDIHGASGKRRGEAQRTGHGGPAQELSVIPGHGTCAWRLAWPWSPARLQRGTGGRGCPEPPPLVRGRRAHAVVHSRPHGLGVAVRLRLRPGHHGGCGGRAEGHFLYCGLLEAN